MTQAEQLLFVTDLTHSIRDQVLGHIACHNIPESWTGVELRELLSELFAQERYQRGPRLYGRRSTWRRTNRYRDYKAAIYDKNLYRPASK